MLLATKHPVCYHPLGPYKRAGTEARSSSSGQSTEEQSTLPTSHSSLVMGGQKADKCLSQFSPEDKQILVMIVKRAQARKIKGSKGDWKEFLRAIDRHQGNKNSDPHKRSWGTLANFVQTFTAEDDIEMVKHMRIWQKRSKQIGRWGDSPEQELVQLTHRHGRYKECYTFPSYSEGWVMTDLGKEDDPSRPEQVLSMDCEMVICEHGERELVRVCMVNTACEMVLDMLVKPTKPVADYMAHITGISEADLEGVTCHLPDAQRAVLDLLTPCTILVGHSLYHDLKALKIDHQRVIDTAFIFQYCNKPDSYIAGLNDLCKAVLGYEFREDGKPHNCLDDAIIPMKIVLHTLEHGLESPIDIPTKLLDGAQLSKLFFHSIPNLASAEDLQKIIPKEFPCELEAISWSKHGSGTTYAVFGSFEEANKAFNDLKGELGRDSYGRPQKIVSVSVLAGSGKLERVSIKVRKMSNDEPNVKGVDSMIAQKRKRNMDMDTEVNIESEKGDCCNHVQELETLRKQVREKDAEILSLQRIIVSLTQNEGL